MLLLECVPLGDTSYMPMRKRALSGGGGASAGAAADVQADDVEMKEEEEAYADALDSVEAAVADIFNTGEDGGRMRFWCRCCPYVCDVHESISEPLPELDASATAKLVGNAAQRHDGGADLNDVIGGEDSWRNAERTTGVRCESCGSGEAFFFQVQTRSADEPATVFYKCVSCGNRWNDR